METNRKRAKVIMLPTDKASCLYKTDEGTLMFNPKGIPTHAIMMGAKGQHLYFINDNEIKEGCHVSFSDFIFVAHSVDDKVVGDSEGNTFMRSDCKKIIATTDPELCGLYDNPIEAYTGIPPRKNIVRFPKKNRLPQPSQAFIEKYCKLGGIEYVDVEYEEY